MDRSRYITIIPAYNEELVIGNIVRNAFVFSNVLVINDGSTDKTELEATKAGARVITNCINQGYVKTLNIGLSWASKRNIEFAVFIDADGEHSPELIKKFINEANNKKLDIIFGIRPSYARITEKLFGLFFFKTFGIYDPLCGMKCVRVKLWDLYGPMENRFTFSLDMYTKALISKEKFTQIEIYGQKRDNSPRVGSVISANIRIFMGLIFIILYYCKSRLLK